MYLLDTNILIHHLNDRHGINQKIQEVGFYNCYISEISILELLYGVANSASEKRAENLINVRRLEYLLEDRILTIHVAFDLFAYHKAQLRQQGLLISDFDLLIGANNYTLISANRKEMERIQGLTVENWLPA